MNKKLRVFIAIIVVLLLVFTFSPYYVKQALIHLMPGIDDWEFFNNRQVEVGDSKEWSESVNYNDYSLSQAERDTLEKYNSVAYLVIKDDSIYYEEYWDSYDENSLSNSFSAAKSIVSLLIGAAIDDGYIRDENQSVGDFIPEFSTEQNKVLKIKDLLTMSSGTDWDESYSSLFSTTTQAYYGNDIDKLMLNLNVVEEPGKLYSYKSGDTQLLSMVLRKATGKTLSEYASEKLWKPLGAVNEALWSLDKEDGSEKAYCCFNSNARDFARFGKLALNNGVIDGDTIISPAYMERALSPASYLRDAEDGEVVDFYGYQWWIMNYKGQEIPFMRGILGQYVFVLREQNAIVVRLGVDRSKAYIDKMPSETYSYVSTALNIIK